jgi:hypothetical protein
MSRDDEIVRYVFVPGEEPTVYTADIGAEVGPEHCKGIDATIAGHESTLVFCIWQPSSNQGRTKLSDGVKLRSSQARINVLSVGHKAGVCAVQ